MRIVWHTEVLGHDRSIGPTGGSIELFGAEKVGEQTGCVVEVGDGERYVVDVLQTGKAAAV
jgi:hypothetical protein